MAEGLSGTLVIESWFGPQIIEEMNGKTIKMMNRLGKSVVSRAKQMTPVDTGRLKDSMKVFSIRREGEEIVMEWGSDVEYALFVEFGTVRMRGFYMMTRAWEELIARLDSHLGDEIRSGIGEIDFDRSGSLE